MSDLGKQWDPVWETIFTQQAWGKYPSEALIRFIAQNYYSVVQREAIRILELGCGPGANLWFLARESFAFTGIDGSASAIDQATARLDGEVPGWRGRGELHVGDISSLPFPDETFDAVIDHESVYCNEFSVSKEIYSEAQRVTKAGGGLFVRTFATGSWGDGTGESVGPKAWLCSEGPLAGKGFARFTSLEDIPSLLTGYSGVVVELLSWSLNGQRNSVKEWIVTAWKPSKSLE